MKIPEKSIKWTNFWFFLLVPIHGRPNQRKTLASLVRYRRSFIYQSHERMNICPHQWLLNLKPLTYIQKHLQHFSYYVIILLYWWLQIMDLSWNRCLYSTIYKKRAARRLDIYARTRIRNPPNYFSIAFLWVVTFVNFINSLQEEKFRFTP